MKVPRVPEGEGQRNLPFRLGLSDWGWGERHSAKGWPWHSPSPVPKPAAPAVTEGDDLEKSQPLPCAAQVDYYAVAFRAG